MKPLLLSVIIPTHNRPRSLRNAVASAQLQTESPLEIIVVDDGSDPPVDAAVFLDSPVPVQIVRNNEALGAAAARNLGVDSASGDLVAFLDDDDTWLPEKLARVKSCLLAHHDADVVIHRTGLKTPDDLGEQQCAVLENPLERMLHRQPPHLDGVAVRRTLHLRSPLDPAFVGAEDLDYLIRLAKLGARMVETGLVLAILGHSETSAIGINPRIQGRLNLLIRHPEILADSNARAFFYLRLGHQYRRNGQRSRALRSFGRSLAARPSSSATKGFLLSVLSDNLQGRLRR